MTNALGDQQAQPPNNPPILKLFSASKSLKSIPFRGSTKLFPGLKLSKIRDMTSSRQK
jgi:hypothetical protein